MSETSIVDVSEENFIAEVIEASQQQPVVVDFWATWCGPCQTLLPVITKVAESYQGQIKLAKVEIDQQQNLAAQFGVRSVPTVKLVKNGQIVDEFTGALAENQIRAFIDKHLEKESDLSMQNALLLYQQGQKEEALKQMGQIIESDPTNNENKVHYARVLLHEGHDKEAGQWLDSLPPDYQEKDDVLTLKAQLAFIDITKNAPPFEILQQSLQDDPSNTEARYQLSAHYLVQNQLESALDELIYIVQHDRKYKDDAGRIMLVKVFDLLGNSHPLVSQYRRKLALILN